MKTVFHPEGSSLSPDQTMWFLIGLGATLAAALAAVLSLAFLSSHGLFSLTLTTGAGIYLVAAPVSGLVAGLLTWWLFIVRSRCATVLHGVFFGAVSSIIAHPLMWVGATLLSSLTGSDLGLNFLFVLPLSLMSLFYVGWITLLVGGAIGGMLMYLQCTLALRSRQRGTAGGKDGESIAAPVEP